MSVLPFFFSMKTITIFGSAFTSPNDKLYHEAEAIGKILAENGYAVCSGGHAGIMEAVSKGVKSAGGKTIGVTVDKWTKKCNQFIDEEIRIPDLMQRIIKLIDLGDAYIVFRGGTGTLLELSAVLEYINKDMMNEKKVLLVGETWQNVIEILKLDSKKLAELIERNVRIINMPDEVINVIK